MNNKSENYISIGEMAKMNQTTVTTLRLYDSMGLLKPCYIDKNSHYRYYDIKQNARFDMIQYMKELGMELREIKDVFDQRDLNLIEDFLRKKKEQARQQLIDIRLKLLPLTEPLMILRGTASLHLLALSRFNISTKEKSMLFMLIQISTITI